MKRTLRKSANFILAGIPENFHDIDNAGVQQIVQISTGQTVNIASSRIGHETQAG